MTRSVPCPHNFTTKESQIGMGRFFSLSNLNRYRILASDAVGVAERRLALKELATEMNAFKRECHAITIRADMKIDRLAESGIERLVDAFYEKIRNDQKLAPLFNRAIPGDWGPHLATMRDFWSSVMLTTGRYKGNPVAKHLQIQGMEPQLFDQWLRLFRETCDELFEDTLAQKFVAKAELIAESLKLSLFYRLNRPSP